MKLYERLLYLHESPGEIASNFAEYLVFDEEANPKKEIPEALKDIIKVLNNFIADREPPYDKTPPWEDFAHINIPGSAPIETTTEAQRAEWEAQRAEEEARQAAKDDAQIKALEALFCALCRVLRRRRLSITPGQFSALKREKIPTHLCKELERLKRPKPAALPPGERLDTASAGALYKALSREGFLNGSYDAFLFYLGEYPTGEKKTPEKGLKWVGSLSGFAYFARCFTEYTQPGGLGYIIREKALCGALGVDDCRRENTIRPYLTDRKKPRISAQIDAAFKEAAEARQKDPRGTETKN